MRFPFHTTRQLVCASLAILFAGVLIFGAFSTPVFAETAAHHKTHKQAEAAKRAHEKHLKAVKAKKSATAKKKKAHAKQLPSAQKAHLKRLAKLEAKHKNTRDTKAHKQHLAKLQKAAEKKHKKLTMAQKAHIKRLAEKLAKEEKLHNKRLARLETKHNKAKAAQEIARKREAHLAAIAAKKEQEAAHQQNLAIQAAAKRERRLKMIAAHRAAASAHLAAVAAKRALIEQEHAQRRERQTSIDLAAAKGIVQWGAYANKVPMQVILVDLNKPNIKVTALLSHHGIGSSEGFHHMIDRSHPAVAVTGTFFSLDNLHPVGDIVIDGNLAYFGGMGTALAITSANHADMITLPWGHHHDWSGYECVVACGPRLLKDGAIWLNPHAERFKDPNMLGPNSRIAVGITRGNKLIFAMTRNRISLRALASAMQTLGCTQAMNLDAGTSTGFYCNGEVLAQPGRKLTNLIIVRTDGKREAEDSQDSEMTEKGI
jgi:hypothetical protein